MNPANLLTLFAAPAVQEDLLFPRWVPDPKLDRELRERQAAFEKAGPLAVTLTGLRIRGTVQQERTAALCLDGVEVAILRQEMDPDRDDMELDFEVDWQTDEARDRVIAYAKATGLWPDEFPTPDSEPLELLRLYMDREVRVSRVRSLVKTGWTVFSPPGMGTLYLKIRTPLTLFLRDRLQRHYGGSTLMCNEAVTGQPPLDLPGDVQTMLEPMRRDKALIFRPPSGKWTRLPGPYTAQRATALYDTYGSKTLILNEMLAKATERAKRAATTPTLLPL